MSTYEETDGPLMGDAGHMPATFPHPDDDDAADAWRRRLIYDPTVSEHSPVVVGTAVTAARVASMVAEGCSRAFVAFRLDCTEADIDACLAFKDYDDGHWKVPTARVTESDSDEVAALASAWDPPRSETRDRIRRCNEANAPRAPLRCRMRSAANRMTTEVERDGTVRIPADAAHFLAALLRHYADRVPVGSDDYETAIDRGLLDA